MRPPPQQPLSWNAPTKTTWSLQRQVLDRAGGGGSGGGCKGGGLNDAGAAPAPLTRLFWLIVEHAERRNTTMYIMEVVQQKMMPRILGGGEAKDDTIAE